jgi:malate permease and related proteins
MGNEALSRVGFLVLLACLGWGAGRVKHLNPKDISTLLVYIISPFVIFISILEVDYPTDYLPYALGAYIASCIAASGALVIGRYVWRNSLANLFAFTGGTANTGYFGLPLVIAWFNAQGIVISVFIILGMNLYEFSYGYYLTARGTYSIYDSLQKIIRLPILYAAALAILCKHLDWIPSSLLMSDLSHFKAVYSVLGMMVIGMTLAQFRRWSVDWRFLVLALSWKHLLWPAAILSLSAMVPLSMTARSVLVLMSCMPMAANTVVVANALSLHPEKAALSVMISTVLSVVTLPFILYMLEINP